MKLLSLLAFAAFVSPSYGDTQAIMLELSPDKLGHTIVSITYEAKPNSSERLTLPDAVKLLHHNKFQKAGTLAVIHAEHRVPPSDLISLLSAMDGNIDVSYIEIGKYNPRLDIWNRKKATEQGAEATP